MNNSFELLLPWFLSLIIILNLLLKLYLNYRQANSIKYNYDKVPVAFQSKISLSDHHVSAKYNLAKLTFSNYHNVISDAMLVLMTLGGGVNLIYSIISHIDISNTWQNIALIIGFNIVLSIVEEPFNLYRIFVIEAKFGFNKITRKTYIIDQIKGVLLSLVFALPLLYFVLYFMEHYAGSWWFYTFILLAGLNILAMSIYPTLIAPLFNKFTQLDDAELKSKIDVLLAKCGFSSNGVFVMDGSKRSSHGNAYFTGFGRNKRIVFYDTLLANLSHDEVLAVLAHELGHFSKKHIINQMMFIFVAMFSLLFILHSAMGQAWFYALLNLTNVNNAGALIGFIILSSFITLPFAPIYNFLARRHEFEADEYAKNHSNKEHLISGLVKLYKDNASTLTPDDLYVKFYYSHPPASIRIARLEQI